MSTGKQMLVIYRLEEIPAFASEAKEHDFWATHELSDALWNQAEPLETAAVPPPRVSTARSANTASHQQR